MKPKTGDCMQSISPTDQDLASRYAQLRSDGWINFSQSGFAELIGPLWERTVDGTVYLGFVAEPKHRNRADVVQGGMIATLADLTLGVTARMHDRGRRQATIQLDIKYIDAAKMGEFVVGKGALHRETPTVAFLSGVIEANGRLVATMSGVWRVKRPKT